jgi:hypothetical protein
VEKQLKVGHGGVLLRQLDRQFDECFFAVNAANGERNNCVLQCFVSLPLAALMSRIQMNPLITM